MSRFIRNISLFVAGLPLLAAKSLASAPGPAAEVKSLEALGPVPLRPLNWESDNLFAGHRSHSSHRSHYSSSGGGGSSYRAPAYVAPSPAPSPAPAAAPLPQHSTSLHSPSPAGDAATSQIADPTGRARSTQPLPGGATATGAAPREEMTSSEKRRLQVMRVQIKLHSLGLYDGQINGVMNEGTGLALRYFQDLKGLQKTGTMTTPTLNAMGIPAVN